LLLLPIAASAQTQRASILGTVTDQNHAVIRGAIVSVVNTATHEARATTSDSQGAYAISSLSPGPYILGVQATGFERFPQPLELLVNQELRVDITMEVAHVSAIVADGIILPPDYMRKDSAAQGTVIENRQVEGLPLDGRNFYELTLLVPGAAPAAPGSAGSVRGDFAFSVNGAREDSNDFLLDGVYNVDPKLNTFAVRPSVDAIQEFETATSTYDAAFGRNPGSQVNVVLKSGTN